MLARNAMATRFELVLYGEQERSLKAAGEEALNEIERIEARISPFKPDSEISIINQNAYSHPIRASIEVYQLLKTANQVWQDSNGAFDITIGQLMRLWGFRDDSDYHPELEDIERIRQNCGMNFLQLDDFNHTVKFLKNAVKIDLGAIGKGYAINQAIEILREEGIKSALLHGGTSTVAAIGRPPELNEWNIAVEIPPDVLTGFKGAVATANLNESSLSISGIWGRAKKLGDKILGHIIDPRTGRPSDRIIMAVVVCKSAIFSDALSTALLVAGEEICHKLTRIYPDLKYLFVKTNKNGKSKPELHFHGIKPLDECEKFFDIKEYNFTEQQQVDYDKGQ